MLKHFCLTVVVCLFIGQAWAQVDLTDASINAGETVTLTADQEYLLDGFVFVEEGATLIIQPGTVIKARQTPTTGDNASALIIARGGKIIADGTASHPIIFTSELDDVSNPTDLTWSDRGLWGGLIVLGRATTNRGIEGSIEGIPTGEARATYGGDNDNDNSGVLRYISIRHGGAELGPGDEINGLTLGAVGSQTVIEHIEIYSNLDDGAEWFGGTVNTKWLVAAFCGDDGFDYDEGWRGKNQFWFVIQGPDAAGRIGEHDGGTVAETAMPFATPEIWNATYIGPGIQNLPQGDGSEAIIFRDNAGGHYANSIITDYNGANNGSGITVEDIEGEDSRSRLENGDLTLSNNIWWQFGNGNTAEIIAPQDFVLAHFNANNNQVVDPQINGISRMADGGLDPRPASDGPAATGAPMAMDPYFTRVPYYGAFSPDAPMWTNGWTALSANNHTNSMVELNDQSINAGQTVTLSAGVEYLMDGFVFVEEGATLIIEPGTVIKAKQTPTTGDNASALIIARGGKIIADGTAHQPIIFTSELDDINNPNDLSWADRGLWGGLIVLGRATTNRGIEGSIEGIPTGETRATYGGENDNDNSGILRYISIRHGGAELGPGDEINGLTLGAVGSQTVIEHIEIFSNLDDGAEWFGGTVNTKWMVAAFCGDDGFDYDEGWRGKNQFWFVIQGPDAAGRIGEHDGGTVAETAAPYATPQIYNATYIGPGIQNIPEGDGSEAIIFRDNAGGHYVNSIITDYNGANDGRGVTVEDIDGEDSRSRLENGELALRNNIWWQFGNGNTLDAIAPQDFVATHLAANNNQIVDPQIGGISRIADGGLDPRPAADGAAASGAQTMGDSFYTPVGFYGAFNPNAPLWTSGWTALSANGHTVSTEIGEVKSRLAFPWVSNSDDFESTLVINNNGQSAAQIRMTARRADGQSETTGVIVVPARGYYSAQASELFTQLGRGTGSTVIVEGNKGHLSGRLVTFDRTNQAPSQGVAIELPAYGGNGQASHAISFGFLPGSGGFQSAPVIVNASGTNANITVYYFGANGNLIDVDEELNVAPWRPVIPRFIDLNDGDVTAIAVSDAGILVGTGFVFNATQQTAIGNATAVPGFQNP